MKLVGRNRTLLGRGISLGSGGAGGGPASIPGIDAWHRGLALPLPRRLWLPPSAGGESLEPISAAETISVDKWYQRLEIPVLSRRLHVGAHENQAMPETPTVLLLNLLAYWKLEEGSGTRNDSHGANHLTDNNTVTSTTGKIGDAAVFEQSNSEYLSRSGTTFRFSSGDFTIALWAYPDSLVGGDVSYGRGLARVNTGDSTGDWAISVLTTGKVRCAHWLNSGADTDGGHVTNDTSLFADSNWGHLVFRYLSGTYTIWVNGVSKAFTDSTTDSGWGNVGFEIGRTFSNTGYYWDGRIDEFGIWNRGLSDNEIAILYNAGSGLAYPFF